MCVKIEGVYCCLGVTSKKRCWLLLKGVDFILYIFLTLLDAQHPKCVGGSAVECQLYHVGEVKLIGSKINY